MGRWRAMLRALPAHYETTAKTDKTSQDQYRTTGFVGFGSQSVVSEQGRFCRVCGRDEAIHTPETRAICDRYTPDPAPDRPGSPLGLAAADYDRIGAEIDALADQAKAARERGDAAEGERLGAQVRALVAGPYLQAGERYTALLAGVAPETVA